MQKETKGERCVMGSLHVRLAALHSIRIDLVCCAASAVVALAIRVRFVPLCLCRSSGITEHRCLWLCLLCAQCSNAHGRVHYVRCCCRLRCEWMCHVLFLLLTLRLCALYTLSVYIYYIYTLYTTHYTSSCCFCHSFYFLLFSLWFFDSADWFYSKSITADFYVTMQLADFRNYPQKLMQTKSHSWLIINFTKI